MKLKLKAEGSKKMEIRIGTIVDSPFLCMKMAYCGKAGLAAEKYRKGHYCPMFGIWKS